MDQTYISVFLVAILSLAVVAGDYCLKIASSSEQSINTIWFLLGISTIALTCFGWVYTMKHLKLASIGAIYSVFIVVALAVVGVVFFQETLNYYEIAGIVMAIASLILLSGFS
jgi:multidrug transporter EmrE-like cation transporter